MNLTIGTLELNKTHSAHMGTGAINTNVNVGGVNGENNGVEKKSIYKCTRAMEQREAATGLSEAREAADR